MRDITFTISLSDDDLRKIISSGIGTLHVIHGNNPLYDLVGKIVLLEASPASRSTYYNGEYVILRQTENTLYGVKMRVGYEAHLEQVFCLGDGEGQYHVAAFREDWAGVRAFADDLLEWSLHPEPKRWIEGVYTGAAQVATTLQRVLKERGH